MDRGDVADWMGSYNSSKNPGSAEDVMKRVNSSFVIWKSLLKVLVI